jgi:antitoxin YefM
LPLNRLPSCDKKCPFPDDGGGHFSFQTSPFFIFDNIMTIKGGERTDMQIIQDYIPITKAKTDLLNLIRKLEDSDDTIAITKNGVPEAVLISIKKFNGLIETINILSDAKAMKSLKKSIKEAKQDRWLEFDEAFGE